MFLDRTGRCRIHSEFGESAKPIACRLYPYVLVPAGQQVRVGVRYSCPSAVRNLGEPVTQQRAELRELLEAVTEGDKRSPTPPAYAVRRSLDWAGTLRLVDAAERIVCDARPFPRRLLVLVNFARYLEMAKLQSLSAAELVEVSEVFSAAARDEVTESFRAPPPSAAAQTLFRLTAAHYARKDVSTHLRAGWRGRWRLLVTAIRFARGRGTVPPLIPEFGTVTFDQLEQQFHGPPDASWQLLERYCRVKLSSVQFAGAANFELPLSEGMYSLALACTIVLWLARWRATGAGRTRIEIDDVAAALSRVDHHFGFNPTFGSFTARSRLRMLARMKELDRLIWHYVSSIASETAPNAE